MPRHTTRGRALNAQAAAAQRRRSGATAPRRAARTHTLPHVPPPSARRRNAHQGSRCASAARASDVLLIAVLAVPGKTQPRRAEHHPDRDVEEVEPVRTSGPHDESPEIIPFGINLRGLGGLGGAGGRPVLAVRPIGLGPRDSSDEDSDEDPSGGGFLHPYFIDPMSSFMAQMAEMMAAMRRQMDQVLHRLPAEGHTDFSKLGNTTSTTKVVDGHIVTVNDTVIGGDDGDDSEIHIRVVDIRPTESPEGADSAEDSDDAKDSAGSKAGQGAEGEDADTDVEPLNEVTPRPNRADNQIPMKVGSEVDDLNA